MALKDTHPTFQEKIARLAEMAGKTPDEIYTAWKGYADECSGWDQSPLLWEFVQWQAQAMGWNVSAAIEAVR